MNTSTSNAADASGDSMNKEGISGGSGSTGMEITQQGPIPNSHPETTQDTQSSSGTTLGEPIWRVDQSETSSLPGKQTTNPTEQGDTSRSGSASITTTAGRQVVEIPYSR